MDGSTEEIIDGRIGQPLNQATERWTNTSTERPTDSENDRQRHINSQMITCKNVKHCPSTRSALLLLLPAEGSEIKIVTTKKKNELAKKQETLM